MLRKDWYLLCQSPAVCSFPEGQKRLRNTWLLIHSQRIVFDFKEKINKKRNISKLNFIKIKMKPLCISKDRIKKQKGKTVEHIVFTNHESDKGCISKYIKIYINQS